MVGGAYVLDGTRGLDVANIPSFNATSLFTVELVLKQEPLTGGYLLARTARAGTMYWGLYQSFDTPALYLYYRPALSPLSSSTLANLQFVIFPVSVNSGSMQTVVLSLTHTAARLALTTQGATQVYDAELSSPVQDCPESKCVLMIGQRANSTAATAFVGLIAEAYLTMGSSLAFGVAANASYFPAEVESYPGLVNLLSHAVPSALLQSGVGYTFGGVGGLQVLPAPLLSTRFSLAVTFMQASSSRGCKLLIQL